MEPPVLDASEKHEPTPTRNYWLKVSICCVWIALAVLPRLVDLDKIEMQVNLHGAMLLTSVLIEASSPIALIWLFMLAKEMK
jgi:hypothetical protein